MARKRKARYTWLPIRGTALGEAGAGPYVTYQDMSVTVVDGQASGGILPVLEDDPSEDEREFQHESMSDLIGSDYVVKRIVGKLFVHAQHARDGAVNPSNAPALWVKTGIFVARTEGGGTSVPLGWASTGTENYSTASLANAREPWLFQRSWVLGSGGIFQPGATINPGSGAQDAEYWDSTSFPPSNVYYGSVNDGAHLDIRVARRVKQDDRLWWTVQVEAYPDRNVPDTSVVSIVHLRLDIRALGALRKARPSSAF